MPREGGGTSVHIEGGDDLEVDAVIVSIGRRALSDDLVDPTVGVVVDERGFVEVDDRCRTAADGVFAVGDLIDTLGLAHVGFIEAILVIKQIIGEEAVPVDYHGAPWASTRTRSSPGRARPSRQPRTPATRSWWPRPLGRDQLGPYHR